MRLNKNTLSKNQIRRFLSEYQWIINLGLRALFKRDLNSHVYQIDLLLMEGSESYKLYICDIDTDWMIHGDKSAKDNIQKIKGYMVKSFDFELWNSRVIKKTGWTEYIVEYEINKDQLETLIGYCRMLANI